MHDLTDRQREMLTYLRAEIEQTGLCPSYREIGAALGINSTNGVSDHIKALERKGYIERVGNTGASRSIRLTDRTLTALAGDGVVGVPLVGRVAAGSLHAAIEDTRGTVRVDQSLLPRSGDVFALQVHGDSMIDDGIHEGDTLFVQRCTDLRQGEIGVVLVDGETTVKRVYRESGRLRLQPSNPDMAPIYVHPGGADITIVGRAVGLWRTI